LIEYYTTGNFKNSYMTTWKVFLQFPHILAYGIWSIVILTKKIKSLDQNSKYEKDNKLVWIKFLIVGFMFCYFLWMLSFVGVFNGLIDARLYDYLSITGMIIFIYSIGYLSFTIPNVHVSIHKAVRHKYANSTLTKTQSIEYLGKLKALMEKEKLYLKQDLSLIDLSEFIKVSPNLISQILNEELGNNFFEFVNHYRVEEAKRLLANQKSKQFTIASIAFDSGFNNKTSFNNYFKKMTGRTPSEYRNAVVETACDD
ncbi:MAG: helix-turn-helix domain-containing protein, partial [Bacteroidota bacterium]